MSMVAIFGAGPIGAATAHRLAAEDVFDEIRLVDLAREVAAGKALDIQQSGAVEGFGTKVTATSDELAAVGAAAIVVADDVREGEWTGGRGERLVERLLRAGAEGPIVFAGPGQTDLIEACFRELKVPARRLVGTAGSAVVAAVRGLAGLELGLSSVELTLVGRPPALVVGWSAATVAGSLVTDRVPPHRLLAISRSVPQLWPPGPQAIAAATAPIVKALVAGSRRLLPAVTVVDGEMGLRATAVLLSLELGHGRILSHVVPSLSPQERGTGLFSTDSRPPVPGVS